MTAANGLGGRTPVLDRLSQTWVLAFLVTLAGAVFTWLLLRPQVGIDDANITHVYADHIARGLGYVYTAGGERVEGSTSFLWTMINVLFFWTGPHPEGLLTIACFGLTVVSVAFGIKIGETIAAQWNVSGPAIRLASAASFLFFPAFFAWSVWTLMDLTIWVTALTLLMWFAVRMIGSAGDGPKLSRWQVIAFVALSAMLPLVRPEGVAVAAGFSVALAIYFVLRRNLHLAAAAGIAAVLALAAFATVTLWRLDYFGYPFPNTFYAKVSTGIVAQFKDGLGYIIGYLVSGPTPFMIALSAGLVAFAWLSPKGGASVLARRDAASLLIVFLAGLCLTYAALGGDHFAAYRFMQPVTPVLGPLAAVAVMLLWSAIPAQQRSWRAATAGIAAAGLLIIPPAVTFSTPNNMQWEFRLAEKGQETGESLSELAPEEGVAVIAAGGIARTYKGRVFDLMGLNWVEMAHAVDDLTGTERNHGGLDETLFLRDLPGVLAPDMLGRQCQSTAEWPGEFVRSVLKGMLEHETFVRNYAQACYKGHQIYIRRDLLAAHKAELEQPKGEIW